MSIYIMSLKPPVSMIDRQGHPKYSLHMGFLNRVKDLSKQMSFIQRFFGKDPSRPEEFTARDVISFVEQKPPLEENVNLDYKSIPEKGLDYAELAKDVSAFANSEGGLLILGISEKTESDPKTKRTVRIHPGEATWGSPVLRRETIEQHLVGKIHPQIMGLRILPIRKSDADSRVIFLIDVPRSHQGPHMATPYNRYYRRLNFENTPMGHYEIFNMFTANWTMKEKLVDKIYEPLSRVIRNQIDQLEDKFAASSLDMKEILSNTYYVRQMPFELFEEIDYYVDSLDKIDELRTHARKALIRIMARNLADYLQVEYDEGVYQKSHFRAMGTDYSPIELFLPDILLKSKTIKAYLDDTYHLPGYRAIEIIYDSTRLEIDLPSFDEHIWSKCLQEGSENKETIELRDLIKSLVSNAWDLLDEITVS